MSILEKGPETIIPSPEDAEIAAESSRILSALNDGRELEVLLDDGKTLPLPKAVRSLLAHLLIEMSNGNAVAVLPIHAELTTQEAADQLNVSRPYLVKLLESGALAYHKVGTHRRVRLSDLLAYKEKIAQQRDAALDELASQAQELDMGY